MYICLRIYLLLFVSFFALKCIKNYLKSTLIDEKLNHLALMHIESSVIKVNEKRRCRDGYYYK